MYLTGLGKKKKYFKEEGKNSATAISITSIFRLNSTFSQK